MKGQVEKTLKIKKNLPKKISILRIDTDWYESTKVELEILFPLLSKNGFLIIDDYGYWSGAKKAVDKGADGLVLVAWGAGGHAGTLSPFALVEEVREWWDGPIALSGAIGSGRAVAAAVAAGADFAYIGSPFIATTEANASEAYKKAIVDGSAEDIVYSNLFTGVPGNYLKASVVNAGVELSSAGIRLERAKS